jgi:hypothetical protein
MPRFAVPPHVRAQRYHSCLSCKHFVSSTRSCGTLIVGKDLTDEQVAEISEELLITHRKKKIRLCGCVMPVKAYLAFASCPIGKWNMHRIDSDDVNKLRAFIDSLEGKSKLSQEEVAELLRWNGMITGKKMQKCTECIRQLLADMRQELNASEE